MSQKMMSKKAIIRQAGAMLDLAAAKIQELEDNRQGMLRMMSVLIDRLGGSVQITDAELDMVKGAVKVSHDADAHVFTVSTERQTVKIEVVSDMAAVEGAEAQ